MSHFGLPAVDLKARRIDYWTVHYPGWLILLYLVYAQALAAIDYELGVSLGTQEPAAVVSEVGVAFWYAFALADVLVYIPILATGLVGMWLRARWGRPVFAAALGITVYWPVVSLVAISTARGASGWNFVGDVGYWMVLPIITVWGLWALWRTVR